MQHPDYFSFLKRLFDRRFTGQFTEMTSIQVRKTTEVMKFRGTGRQGYPTPAGMAGQQPAAPGRPRTRWRSTARFTWLKALIANDLKRKDRTAKLYQQLVAADAEIDPLQQASLETDRVLMDVRKWRRDRGISGEF
jgi:hypothetical protein